MATPTKPTPYQNRLLAVPQDVNLACLGGRGGGKSTGAAFLTLRHCIEFGDAARPLLVRETYKSLTKLWDELEQIFGVAFGQGVKANRSEHIFRLPNNAFVELAQVDSMQAYNKHQGRETSLLIVDEVGNFKTDRYINLLRSNLRGPAGMPLRVVLLGNPGGPLHAQLARKYVNGRIPWQIFDVDGEDWILCPSVYTDNVHIDPARYAHQIRVAAGHDAALCAAWLEGNWADIRGAYFANVFGDHLILPDDGWRIPGSMKQTGWYGFVAADWGYSAPSVAGYFALAMRQGLRGPGNRPFPKGSYILLGETHTARSDDLATGLQWPPQKLAEEILAGCERHGVWPQGVIDDARGLEGSSLIEQFQRYGLSLERPMKDRISGWVRLKSLMAAAKADDPDQPGFWMRETARYCLETLPTLPRDEIRPEDLDTASVDHGADMIRYGVNHKPRISRITRVKGLV